MVENSWHLNSGIFGIFIFACARHIAYRRVNLYSTGHVEDCEYLVRIATVRISAVHFLTVVVLLIFGLMILLIVGSALRDVCCELASSL